MEKNRSSTSFVEDHEEEEAKQFIEEELGFPLPKVFGNKLLVKIYIRPEELSTFQNDKGETLHIYMPEAYLANDQYSNFSALVLGVGDKCFKGKEYKDSGPGCKVGDWVTILRNGGGQQYLYKGVAVQSIPESALLDVIEDPSYVQRVN
jgi:hypothetical protein